MPPFGALLKSGRSPLIAVLLFGALPTASVAQFGIDGLGSVSLDAIESAAPARPPQSDKVHTARLDNPPPQVGRATEFISGSKAPSKPASQFKDFDHRESDLGIFGSIAIPISGLPIQRSWQQAIASGMDLDLDKDCFEAGGNCRQELLDDWRASRALAAAGAGAEAISIINRSVNRSLSYASDTEIYGELDHWSASTELIRLGRGDCEDFALAKFWLLRDLGVSSDAMQFVVVRDLRRRLFHAVLVVHLGGKRFVLDNLSDRVTEAREIDQYRPVISFVGDQAFIHGFKKQDGAPIALSNPFGFIAPGMGEPPLQGAFEAN